jgi:hypothetical protein
MHIKAPRLYVNRCGVYYFRVKSGGSEKRICLRTKFQNCLHYRSETQFGLGEDAGNERSEAVRGGPPNGLV